jgi:nitrogenase molybdenum-iron protein alpha/beta subunit
MTRTSLEIPRSTCRLFGTVKALSTVQRSAILVHGPKGCVYHINYIMGMRGDRPGALYTTSLDEQDVIFGAEGKLTAAIGELDRKLSPDLIFVLSCCATSIIGEDVESACRAAETRARVLGFESGGFEGDHHTAYGDALSRLAGELAGPAGEIVPRTVNLVGMLRAGPDLRELRRVLSLAGITVTGVLSAGASLGELEGLGRAAANIVVCEPAGRPAAELLEERFGTPFIVAELPIGSAATLRFLEQVGGALGVPVDSGALRSGSPGDPGSLGGRRIAVVSGPTRAISMARYLAECGNPPFLVVVDFDTGIRERLASLAGPGCEVLIEPSQEEIAERIRAKGIDLLIGGMLERPLAVSLGIEHLDIMHGSQRTVGFEGARTLRELFAKKR